MTPQVSVIIPAYHAKETIARAVQSVLLQTITNWEAIIIADDEQDYKSFLKTQGITDKRLRFIGSGGIRTGVSAARNAGLAHARAQIIALLDADDAFYSEKLACMVPLAQRHGLCTSAFNHVIYEQGKKRLIGCIGQSEIDQRVSPADFIKMTYTASAMIVFDKTRLPFRWREDLKVMEDAVFCFTAFDTIPHIYHVGTPMYEYIVTPGSLTNSPETPANFIETKYKLIKEIDNGSVGFNHPQMLESFKQLLSLSIAVEKEYEQLRLRGQNPNFTTMLMERLNTNPSIKVG